MYTAGRNGALPGRGGPEALYAFIFPLYCPVGRLSHEYGIRAEYEISIHCRLYPYYFLLQFLDVAGDEKRSEMKSTLRSEGELSVQVSGRARRVTAYMPGVSKMMFTDEPQQITFSFPTVSRRIA